MNRPAHDVVAETQDPSAPVVLRMQNRRPRCRSCRGGGLWLSLNGRQHWTRNMSWCPLNRLAVSVLPLTTRTDYFQGILEKHHVPKRC